jgi:SnoaL-like domain
VTSRARLPERMLTDSCQRSRVGERPSCPWWPYKPGMNNTIEVGQRYVALCKEGKFDACLRELFSEEAVSAEAWAPPGVARTASGLPAIAAKGERWSRDHDIHAFELSGPFPFEQRFAVYFRFEITHKPSQRRMHMEEVGLFLVENGKIVREEFFYAAG